MSHPTAEMISLAEFARRAGCDRKQVRRAIEKGLLAKGEGDLLAASEVDSGWRRPNRRTIEQEGETTPPDEAGTTEVSQPVQGSARRSRASVPPPGETAIEAAERIVSSRPLLSTKEATQLKENYLARAQQLSYDLKAGTVVLIDEVGKAVAAEYAGVRKKLLAIPAERAPAVHRLKTVSEIEAFLRSVIVEALEELTRDGSPPA